MIPLILTGLALGLSAAGTFMQYQGAQQQTEAMQQQIMAERRAEELRKKQMEIEAHRRSLEIVRNQQRARAQALAASTNQGASGGSGLQGGYGQISGDANNQLLATAQNLSIGRGLFDANMAVSNARMSYAEAGSDLALGRAISGIGSTVNSLTPQITSLANNIPSPQAQGNPFPTPYGSPYPIPYRTPYPPYTAY